MHTEMIPSVIFLEIISKQNLFNGINKEISDYYIGG